MNKDKMELIESLKKENKEFSQLMNEHKEFEERLEELNKLKYLTPEQEIEKKKIQKLKLKGKDRMNEIITSFRSGDN